MTPVVTDDLNRPKIKLRKHDVEVGWFACVAERNGSNSIEQIQAKGILDVQGQYFWPQLVKDGVQVVTQRQIEGKKSRG